MEYRILKKEEAGFLTSVFTTPEYQLYFAENDTTKEEWEERLTLFDTKHSYIISKNGEDVGWIMYDLKEDICEMNIIVLLPSERCKGYGKEIFSDLLKRHPQIKTINLDVQQRNKNAVIFYTKMGFQTVGEEYQLVNEEKVAYYKMTETIN